MRNTTIVFTTALATFLLPGARLLAQEATPSPAVTEATATPAAAATPAKPKEPRKSVAPATPVAPASPVATSSATKSTHEEVVAQMLMAQALVEELRATVDFQVAQAQRIELRGPLAPELQGEIKRARERATDHAVVQLARVQKAMMSLTAGSSKLPELVEEIEALSRVTEEGSERIAGVLTRGGRTEETLQEIASCFEEIAEKAESAAERLEEEGERSRSGVELTIDGEHGSVRIHGDGSDRVSYGSPVDIKEGESVQDAVAIMDNLNVSGTVLGDAVAIFGDVKITKTGRVEGDAASIFGHVLVDEGGLIDGERISLGTGALIAGMRSAPVVPKPWPMRLGGTLLTAGAQFLCFFLLGLLAIAMFPRRIAVVSEELAAHPIKAGALGVLASIAWLPITLLLVVTIVGIILIPFFWVAYPVFGFVGYVALALIIGRKLPTKVIPTNTAVFAIGAAVIVAIGLIPILGKLVWVFAGFFALGATLMTRFGQDRSNGNAPAVPGDMASIA